ncbi:endonuclease/exonuclease/phosphatase domain-containing protein [Heterostelium album PN500]|uniref:Endonuclease/exonuclease/phosphatase domain-containing protein n=1 Tax=Heterostelium pallidum (strain ATCC 26659 / Pp 5 / PN500) TaxID=670386 RepID=D3BAT8_HETP5|nr:endonuclease/exonuclease/phosphatase domain-containing protein [Heterostelium album PN500]EFA81675.1 endonuclease/exonuclease/phosphatase domain-containing protein [Heterostelium album PN500]|eukprot:XP_020433792.1 endonuclease/exonuclease/phosphatase domain-containing protein [Heterostelium album PN500]
MSYNNDKKRMIIAMIVSLFPPVPVVNVPLRLAYRETVDPNKVDSAKTVLFSSFKNFIHYNCIEDLKIYIDDVEYVKESGVGLTADEHEQQQQHHSKTILSKISKFFKSDKSDEESEAAQIKSVYGVTDSNIIPLNEENALFIPRVEHANKQVTLKFTIKKKPFELKATVQHRHPRVWSDIKQLDLVSLENEKIEEEQTAMTNSSFRVMQFNILADCYTSPANYVGCPVYSLYRNYRQWVLPEYILEHSPDVVCLQEAEVRMERLTKKLVEAGYLHTPLCDLARYEEEQSITYFKTSRYQPIELQMVHYKNLKNLLTPAQLDPLLKSSITAKYLDLLSSSMHHNKFSLALLQDKQTSSSILFGSVHLHWGSPDFDINYIAQVIQLHIFMMVVGNLLDKHSLPRDTPLVICGDYNNGPTQKAYTLMDYGQYELNGYTLSHSFKMSSAYSHRPDGEPKYTIRTNHFTGSIDQIWMSEKLRVSKLLEIGDHYPRQLPSLTDPSDHIMMLADLYVSKHPRVTLTAADNNQS